MSTSMSSIVEPHDRKTDQQAKATPFVKLYVLTECLLIPLTFNHNILCVLNDQRVTFAYQNPGKPCVNREMELGSSS